MLTTDRLNLNLTTEDDWQGYAPVLSAPETSRYSDLPRKPSDKKIRSFVSWMVGLNSRNRGKAWMIRTKESNAIVGCIRLNKIDRKTSIATIGYELSTEFWGNGLMVEALQSVEFHCFEDLALYRLEAWTYAENKASRRVLEKAGFHLEGIQRKKIVDGDARLDLCLYGKLKTD